MFLFGRSFGGLLATNMATGPVASNMFTGVCTLTPYYRCWTEKLYNCKNLINFLDTVHPRYIAPSEFQERSPEWLAKWGELHGDPNCVSVFTARTGALWIEEQEKAEQSLLETDLPFLIIEAEKDDVVRNDIMRQYYEKAKREGKKHEYCIVNGEETDHTIVTMCPVLGSMVMRNVVRFFDNLIKEKEQKKAES